MGRGSNRAKGNAKSAAPRESQKDQYAPARELEKRLADALDELQTRKRELAESQEQQTATSEILRVISNSLTDTQPVFDTIVRRALALTGGLTATVLRLADGVMHLGAFSSTDETGDAALREFYPKPAIELPILASIVECRTAIAIGDAQIDERVTPAGRQTARARGYRSLVFLPMLRDDTVIGVIGVTHREVAAFGAEHVRTLQTFADQAVIAIENVRLFTELQEKNRALTQAHSQLTESLEQQTGTVEILRVIASSPTDAQPVFDTIAANASRLCGGIAAIVARFDGEMMHLVAHHNPRPGIEPVTARLYPRRPGRDTTAGRAILERSIVHISDADKDPDLAPNLAVDVRAGSFLAVPIMRDGRPIGAISVSRVETGAFPAGQVELLQTFADQAVIAIENVRLFKELQTRNSELTQALDRQTATAEILGVISSSPTDVQPVLDAVTRSAMRLCEAYDCWIGLRDGDQVRVRAHHGPIPVAVGLRPLRRGRVSETAILDRKIVHVHDLIASGTEFPQGQADALRAGHRTTLGVPLIREGEAIGVILIRRLEVRPFTDTQIALLKTFADQAVIAIENVRLFKELEEKNRRLTVALDQQTATSEVLRAISSSVIDLQPVFDTIVRNAVKLCSATFGGLQRIVDGRMTLDAQCGVTPDELAVLQRDVFPLPISRGSATGRAVVDRTVVHIRDIREDPEFGVHPLQAMQGFRTILAVPMLREGVPIGALALWRREVLPFSDTEISLVQTFADQAVIAIENVRLFKELDARTQDLTRSVGELRALGEVGQAISSTLDLQTVLRTIVARATQLSGTDAGVIYEYDAQREVFLPRATEHLEAEIVETMLATPVRKGEGATGRLAEVQEAIQVPDILAAPAESRVRNVLVRAGYRALLAAPLVREDQLIGALTVIRKATGEFRPEVIDLLRTFATQSALAIQNARLFREIADKSRQLEAASQHKSEFLANMSHELRTPLNAIIGFSEVLSERMFGELNEKQDEYLKDIHASGQHLLSLINDILDLSKIEAGRMELDLTDFSLPLALDNAVTLVRERAGRRGIALHMTIDERLEQVRADERKVRQVVLNLLSNAIKFTPEGGRIDVGAKPVDGFIEVSVSDTGVGIAPEDQEAVFEEFRQVGTADKKVEGTGLGLALSRKFIELHGGTIWVKSRVGVGSTFTFTLPVRRG